jgi:hypothetical protein
MIMVWERIEEKNLSQAVRNYGQYAKDRNARGWGEEKNWKEWT